jgi:pilus assembly protein Flp/PilA
MLAYIRNVANAKRDDEGASAVEYGLLVAAIAALIILVVFALGGWIKGAFRKTCTAFSTAPSATALTTTQAANCDS